MCRVRRWIFYGTHRAREWILTTATYLARLRRFYNGRDIAKLREWRTGLGVTNDVGGWQERNWICMNFWIKADIQFPGRLIVLRIAANKQRWNKVSFNLLSFLWSLKCLHVRACIKHVNRLREAQRYSSI